jgi:hypothetical protein
MTASVSGTPLEALIEHAAAFSSKDDGRYALSLSLPFVHLWQDGEILRYDEPYDVDLFKHYARARIDAEVFGRTRWQGRPRLGEPQGFT